MAETLNVEDVLKRIKQLTDDLEKIRKGCVNKIGPLETSLSANDASEVESTQAVELHAAIDDLQHVLWLYQETANSQGFCSTASTTKLLSRATDILCALSTSPPLPRPDGGANGASFVERLIKLMDATPDPLAQPKSAADKAFQKAGAEQPRA
jgi:hypothetical protein